MSKRPPHKPLGEPGGYKYQDDKTRLALDAEAQLMQRTEEAATARRIEEWSRQLRPVPNLSARESGSLHRQSNQESSRAQGAPCAWCRGQDHQLSRCPFANEDGYVPGCGRCNSIDHSFDDCEKNLTNPTQEYHYKRTLRGNKPPAESRGDWRLIKRHGTSEFEKDQDLPLSLELSRSKANKDQWIGWRRGADGSGITFGEDPYWRRGEFGFPVNWNSGTQAQPMARRDPRKYGAWQNKLRYKLKKVGESQERGSQNFLRSEDSSHPCTPGDSSQPRGAGSNRGGYGSMGHNSMQPMGPPQYPMRPPQFHSGAVQVEEPMVPFSRIGDFVRLDKVALLLEASKSAQQPEPSRRRKRSPSYDSEEQYARRSRQRKRTRERSRSRSRSPPRHRDSYRMGGEIGYRSDKGWLGDNDRHRKYRDRVVEDGQSLIKGSELSDSRIRRDDVRRSAVERRDRSGSRKSGNRDDRRLLSNDCDLLDSRTLRNDDIQSVIGVRDHSESRRPGNRDDGRSISNFWDLSDSRIQPSDDMQSVIWRRDDRSNLPGPHRSLATSRPSRFEDDAQPITRVQSLASRVTRPVQRGGNGQTRGGGREGGGRPVQQRADVSARTRTDGKKSMDIEPRRGKGEHRPGCHGKGHAPWKCEFRFLPAPKDGGS